MTGYEWLVNLPDDEMAYVLGTSKDEAAEIKQKPVDGLFTNENICLETMRNVDFKGNCRDKQYCCYDCRKEFLENELTVNQCAGET